MCIIVLIDDGYIAANILVHVALGIWILLNRSYALQPCTMDLCIGINTEVHACTNNGQ